MHGKAEMGFIHVHIIRAKKVHTQLFIYYTNILSFGLSNARTSQSLCTYIFLKLYTIHLYILILSRQLQKMTIKKLQIRKR